MFFGSGVDAPVDDVKSEVGERKQDPGVRVDHVAIAHEQLEMVSQRRCFPQTRAQCKRSLGYDGVLRGHRRFHSEVRQLREGAEVNVCVMETAVKGHGLGSVKSGELRTRRKHRYKNS